MISGNDASAEVSVLHSSARGVKNRDCHEIVTLNHIKQAKNGQIQKNGIRCI